MDEDHWTEEDARDDLRERSDYRRQSRKPHEDPEKTVRRAFLGVLRREPDPGGFKTDADKVVSDHGSEQDVARELRNSDEFRGKHR